VEQLGTVLTVWAHPDDETYLAGGLCAALVDAGHRVVCVTATRGEAGEVAPGLSTGATVPVADLRTAELEEALAVLGVDEHHWLDYPDGGCAAVPADEPAARIRTLVYDVRPDTVLTFGPDGFTGHPDHRAVSAWVDLALEGTLSRPRVLHAVARTEVVDAALDEDFGVFELGRPRRVPDAEVAVLLELEGAALDRKVEALLRQESQTRGLVDTVGLERFAAWVAAEAFAVPPRTG
jgi:LmbE family N-acetylglucosaminyl deacetylase